MVSVDTLPSACTEPSGLERLRYFPRQLLTADDMRIEQEYFRDKQRRHNRFLHGWGVVCGLEVKADPDDGPLALRICPGYALGPCGDEIYVPEGVPFDLSSCTRRTADPCAPASTVRPAVGKSDSPSVIVVAIRYTECPTRPLRTMPAGCGCDETACEYSRIRDGFEIRCTPKVTRPTDDNSPTLCAVENDKGQTLPKWRLPPTDPWVELAEITLKKTAEGGLDPAVGLIDNGTRRIVYSSAMLQEQLIICCCK